ncbi:MAG: serine/threonine-protein kinase, partial [Candidatus Vecturithrix sp.]|nr:serine/threonine-protein kinase [Candidatus Vecturithrix sp.]
MDIDDILQHRYRIESILGQGSMGTTYRAMDVQENRVVALKQLHFSRLQEWKPLELFEREAKILQKLNHPRIPTYIDYFTIESSSDAQFILVQEYVDGKTLQHLIEGGWRGTEREILDIFLQLINILAYLHTLHPPVIHRDINPKNLLLSQTNEVYLVDFGAVQEKIRTTFLGGSTIVGTYGYVPFEQFSGQAVPASDYYAAGATLLYMLSHRHPSNFPTEQFKPA